MSSESAHLGERIQDLLDGRLGAVERAQAETHLAACPQCRRELEAMRWVKAASRKLPQEAVPTELSAALSTALDREDRDGTALAGRSVPTWPKLGAALAFSLVLLIAVAVLLARWRRAPDLPSAVARDYLAYSSARLPLDLRTADVRKLEGFFAARGIAFETRVFDLGMMGYRVVGGRVHSLSGRPSALFVYEAPGGKLLLCQMYLGRPSDLPPGAVVREHDGIRFHVYLRDGMTLVFWQEGAVTCVLASHIAAEEVVQLAFAKAVKVAANAVASPSLSALRIVER